MRKRSARGFFYREFICPICQTRQVFPKGEGTEKGHIKTVYCPICKEEQDLVQIQGTYIRGR